MILNATLQSVEEHRNKLLHVLLNHHVHRLSKGLIGDTECARHEIQTSRLLKISEYPLDLVEKIIVNKISFTVWYQLWLLTVVYAHQQVSEGTVEIELLDHGIHITDVTEILES